MMPVGNGCTCLAQKLGSSNHRNGPVWAPLESRFLGRLDRLLFPDNSRLAVLPVAFGDPPKRDIPMLPALGRLDNSGALTWPTTWGGYKAGYKGPKSGYKGPESGYT